MMKGLNENRNKKRIAPIVLMAAMFLNPMGYAELFKIMMNLIGSYWYTTLCFYLASALLFGLYFWLLDKKPITYIIKLSKEKLLNIKEKK
jgi:hypothetical protein